MGISPHVLFTHLACDLAPYLPSLDFDEILEKDSLKFWPGITPQQVSCVQLLRNIVKKFVYSVKEDADAKALAKFIDSNEVCLRVDAIDRANLTALEDIAINEAKGVIYDLFFNESDYILSVEKILENLNTGPGASIGATGDSYYHKIGASPMTCTSKSLFSLYKRDTAAFNLLDEAEQLRSKKFGGAQVVSCSKLSFVPKSSEISRTICTEPLLNMMFQKGIARCMEESLARKVNIDLRNQQFFNRELARRGSLTGKFGTIDLSSASDTIALCLVEELLPAYVTSWLKETRTPYTMLPDGREIELHMVSSMGNAFTFPLQTMIFTAVVLGCYRALDIKVRFNRPKVGEPGNWAVFGDDIIVDRKAYDLVVSILTRFGFQVNEDKSYNEGPFRESCGADFWSGVFVRAVYCKRLDTLQDRYSLINRLNVWSANNGVPLPQTVQLLMKGTRFLPVPPWEMDTAGVKVPLSYLTEKFNIQRKYGSIVYRRYEPKSKSISLLNVAARPIRAKRFYHNPAAIIVSAVRGTLRDGRITFRQLEGKLTYKTRLAIAPSWDYYDPCHSQFWGDGWRDWCNASLVEINLGTN